MEGRHSSALRASEADLRRLALPPESLGSAYQALLERMAWVGLVSYEPAWVTRIDVAVRSTEAESPEAGLLDRGHWLGTDRGGALGATAAVRRRTLKTDARGELSGREATASRHGRGAHAEGHA